MFSNTEFNHLKLKLDQLYLSLSGGKVNGETVFSKKVTFGSGDKAIKIYDGKIEGLDSPGGHTYDLELDGTQLTLTEDSEDKTTVQIPSTVVGACTTAAATAAKVVTLTDVTDFELTKGTVIVVKFTNTNTAQNPTLNVNGTGAKSIYYNTSVVTTSSLWVAAQANRYMEYMYDGTNWVWISQCFDNNTTYSAMSKSELTTGTATTSRVVRADYLKSAILDLANPIGTVIESTTCDTMAKVVAAYGGTTWIQHSGYMLRGATSGVVANSVTNDGGADSVTVSSVASHNHGSGKTGAMSANASHSHGIWLEYGAGGNASYPPFNGHTSNGYNQLGHFGPYTDKLQSTNIDHTHSIQSEGANYTVNTLPKYKNVYMWERTA